MELSFGNGVLLLLLVAAVVAMLTRRLRLPYSVGLVAAGMCLALLPAAPKIAFSSDLIYTALLPPLLFEAALYLRWSELRRELPLILTLATAGVLLSATVAAAGMRFAAGWQWPEALVFGTLIAATDPVSVLATFREAGAHGRLALLIESESLLNDGTAAVAFGIAVSMATAHGPTAGGITTALAVTVVGAIACGAAVGLAALFLIGRAADHLVELTFTTVAAYGSFLIAERLGCSGVFATIAAGLIMGNWGPHWKVLSERGKEAVQAFWEYAAFAANSLVFLLIGMYLAGESRGALWLPATVAVVSAMLGRAAAVYPLCLLFRRSSLAVTPRHQHALAWGGLRGALALALALGLPADVPARAAIITVSFAVVAFSVFVQGLTMPPLLRAIGEIPRYPAEAVPARRPVS